MEYYLMFCLELLIIHFLAFSSKSLTQSGVGWLNVYSTDFSPHNHYCTFVANICLFQLQIFRWTQFSYSILSRPLQLDSSFYDLEVLSPSTLSCSKHKKDISLNHYQEFTLCQTVPHYVCVFQNTLTTKSSNQR